MGVPAKSEAFSFMAQELHLRVHCAGWQAGVLRTIPDHHPTICAHCRNDIRVLWLITGLVDLALVIDLLHNIELDFHLCLL